MRPAAAQADLVKEQGSHVFAMGVGAAVTKKASADRLTAISGPDKLPPSAFSRADFTLVQDFDDLAEALRHIANELCRASVTITKLVDEGDGQYKPDRGWDFTAAVSTSPGSYAWLQPAPPPERGPRTVTTDADGVATVQWQPTDATATSTITIAETQRAGYRFVSATCTRGSPTQSRRTTTRSFALVAQLVLGPNEHFTCAVRNQIVPGTIEIEKQATPQGPTSFPFSGSLGDFSLVDDDTGDSASKVVSNLPPGTYTVQELVPAEWELSGVTCTPARAATISAAQVAITLTPGGSVVCTYSDLRVQPPVAPEPTPTPTPTPSPGPTPSPSPVPPAPAEVAGLPVAALRVVKAGPRVARVGDRVPFALTVTNIGANAAMSVQVADVPPAAVTLTGLSATAGMRRVRGNAVWRLGTLAPGASRTVRGSVLIKAGTPGLKRNLALATAANAHLVSSRVDTRVLGPLRPSFTG
jgi:uncharacterized repeat protein (TIGR01451 family)